VEAVNVLVAVHDEETGEFVTDLSRRDFQIYEDGILQEITNFAQQTDLPLTIALCVDTSSSVKLKLGFEKEAATDFLFSVLRPVDKALLLEFDTGVTLLHDFTSNPNDLVREIESLKAGGGTSLYDAIYLVSEQKMLEELGRKTVVILSDGSDLTSKHTFQEALDMVYQAEATVYAISTTRFGADIDHEGDNALRQLTETTGGRAFFPFSANQLSSAFQNIDRELRSQYNLAYVPTNKERDGSFRNIKVRIGRDNVRIRYRKGYFAPLEKGS
jgi:Ca-activated chloride channel homolog